MSLARVVPRELWSLGFMAAEGELQRWFVNDNRDYHFERKQRRRRGSHPQLRGGGQGGPPRRFFAANIVGGTRYLITFTSRPLWDPKIA